MVARMAMSQDKQTSYKSPKKFARTRAQTNQQNPPLNTFIGAVDAELILRRFGGQKGLHPNHRPTLEHCLIRANGGRKGLKVWR